MEYKTVAIPKEIASHIKDFANLHAAAREAENSASAAKRALAKLLKTYLAEHEYPEETVFFQDYAQVMYCAAEAEKIPAEKWLQLYEEKVISRSEFLNAISVLKTEATQAAGHLTITKLTETVKGKTPDVRMKKLDEASPGHVAVPLPSLKAPKVLPKRRAGRLVATAQKVKV